MSTVRSYLRASTTTGCDRALKSLVNTIELAQPCSQLTSLTTSFLGCRTSATDDLIAVPTSSGTVCVFDADDLKCQVRVSPCPTSSVFWCDGKTIVAGTSEGDLVLIDAVTGKLSRRLPVTEQQMVRSVHNSGDDIVAWSAIDGSFGVADIRQHVNTFVKRNSHQVKGIENRAISSILIAKGGYIYTGGATDGTVKLWDMRNTSKETNIIPRFEPDRLRGQGIVSLDLDPEQGRLLSARRGGTVAVHNLSPSIRASSTLLKTMYRSFAAGSYTLDTVHGCARFARGGDMVALSGIDGCVVFSTENPNFGVTLELDGSETIGGCDWLSDGSLVAASTKGSLYQWKNSHRGFRLGSRKRSCRQPLICETTHLKRSMTG